MLLKFVDVRSQLGFARHTAEVKAYHFKGLKRWLSFRLKTNQQPCYDRTVSLNLSAVGAMAQQMSAAEYVLEESKKDFNSPSLGVDERDDLSGYVEQVSRDSQDTIAINS